ncbi:MAG TPA: hypothetical protein PLJ18_12240 [Niabella sp.]|nr:hypothetical protein [Niabella sp.]
MKPEKKLKLSIEALDNFGVYPEIIKDMLNYLNKLVAEKKSERIAKEHFRNQSIDSAIEVYNVINRIIEICNEEYAGDEKINDILKYLKNIK